VPESSERGKIAITTRAALTTSFLLVSIVAIFGYGSSLQTAESTAVQPVQKPAIEVQEFKSDAAIQCIFQSATNALP
jgi:type II secretory pathway component PulC